METKNVILNGSFECEEVLGNLTIPNWDWHYINFEENRSGGIEITSILKPNSDYGYSYESNKAPGIYQSIDLSNYDSTVQLDIKMKVNCPPPPEMDDVNEIPPFEFFLYVYEREDREAIIIGNYDDYVFKKKCSTLGSWVDGVYEYASVQLNPKKYIIGIGCDFRIYKRSYSEHGTAREGYCTISKSIVGLQLLDIEVIASETKTLSPINLIKYQNYGSPFPGTIISEYPPYMDKVYNCPEDITNDRGFVLGTFCSKETTLDAAANKSVGLYYTSIVPEIPDDEANIDEFRARVRFWFRSDLPEVSDPSEKKDIKFKVLLFDSLSPRQYYIDDEITITNEEWTLYTKYIDLIFSEHYRLVIVPPADSYYSQIPLLVGSNIEFSIFTKDPTNKAGTFDDPYTDKLGSIFWDCGFKGEEYYAYPQFKFHTGRYPKKHSFIRIKSDYYVTKDDSGNLYSDCLVTFTDGGNKYYRYFDENSVMAINTELVYKGKHYTVDENGIATFDYVMEELNLSIQGYENTVRVVDVLEGDEFTIIATFNEMNPPVTLELEYDSDLMHVLDTQINEQVNEYGVYNTTNVVTILAKSYCANEPITFSYVNFDGSVISKTVSVYISDGAQVLDDVVLELPYSYNYITPDTPIQLKCLAKPLMIYDLPVDWVSSDWFIDVDAFGNVRGLVPGLSGTVTAINYRSGSSVSCKIHVVDKLEVAGSVYISLNQQVVNDSTIDLYVNDVINLNATVYAGGWDDPAPVGQDVVWKSSSDWVATVDEFGYVKATSTGTATITCHPRNNRYGYAIASVTINVLGDWVPLKYIELNKKELTFICNDSSVSELLTPTLVPANTTQTGLIWKSRDTNIIEVDQEGRVSRPKAIGTTIVSCTSLTNVGLYDECVVTVVDAKDYVPKIEFSTRSITAFRNETVRIDYETTNSAYVSISMRPIITKKEDGSKSTNSATVYDDYIEVTCSEAGEFIITVVCDYTVGGKSSMPQKYVGTFNETFELSIHSQDLKPEFIKGLTAENVYYNGSYVLSYYVKDDIDPDEELVQVLYIDNIPKLITPQVYLCDGSNLYYIFGRDLGAGNHKINIEVRDSRGNESQSADLIVEVPKISSHKAALEDSKLIYDVHIANILNLLHALIDDEYVLLEEKQEFETKYEKFNYAYENLAYVLNLCIKQINDQIGESQVQMAALANALASDGTSIASYSEGDYTNSTFETVTDMDYYQNECIKELVNRVLQLEALVQQLMNNNE